MKIVTITLFLLLGFCQCQQIPDYITRCVRTNPDFQQCAIASATKAIPHILRGDRKYNIPSLTPFKIPKVTIQTSSNLKIVATDLVIYGIDTVKLKNLMFDFDKKTVKISLLMDYLTVLSQYEIDGRLIVPLQGRGSSNITTTNSNIDYRADFSIQEKDGKDYMNIDKDLVTMKSEDVHYQLENLFGNQQLSDETNNVLNEHSKEIANELRGPVSETIRSAVSGIIRSFLTKIPMDEIFLKD
ncbi:hypothetical protein Trydic_g21630 [Trypoxylus dichotomus]